MSQSSAKIARANDEIKLVNHFHKVIKNGLLGRNEDTVIGIEPSKKFFSGVLFPDFESFLQQQDKVGEQDPQPIYRSLAKNCNIGLEFLVKPVNNYVQLNISGSFNLYIRVLPSFSEQNAYLSALETGKTEATFSEVNDSDEHSTEPEEFENQTLDEKKNEDKGLKLLDKYRLYVVSFNDLPCIISTEQLENFDFDLEQFIREAMVNSSNWEDIFSIRVEEIHQTGTVPLKSRSLDSSEFDNWLKSIKSSIPNFPGWSGSVKIEARPYKFIDQKDVYKLMVTLVNTTKVPRKDLGEKPTGFPLEFYDCTLKVEIRNGKHVPFEFDGAPRDYKHDKTYQVRGINSVGILSNATSHNTTFETECVPNYFQKLYRTREDLFVKFYDLSDPQGAQRALGNIAVEMRRFLGEWNRYIAAKGYGQLRNDSEIEQCQKEYDEFQSEIESFELGIHSLTQIRDKRLMRSFNLMNEVFGIAGKGKYDSWRLFQIVFIVRLLPSLFAREVTRDDNMYEKIIKEPDFADVLWFPTGGGKTEAYLGLIVCALFYDRLRGKKRGCSAWVRFPLRMLSKNQLDRLAKILIYAEEVRQSLDEFVGKGKPFSIGFFAGGGNTPNFINEKAVNRMLSSESTRKKMMLIHKCPRCNEKLELDFDFSRWRIIHKCKNEKCFVFRSKELDGILPFYITDSEIYRFVPSVLCGTVDKLSIVGRYREFSHIFGQIGGVCSKHGFYSEKCIVGSRESTCDEKITVSSKKEGQKVRASIYDPVPSLFIQDELHLLKEELGVLNGHYEGILNEFSRYLVDKPGHLPKVVAATATIESYEHHIKHLYLRNPRRYPSMGYVLGESFYATSSPEIMRRLYIGILPHTKSQEEVMGRALFLYHKEIYMLYREASNVWKTFDFESIKSEADFLKLLAYYDLSVIYVNQKPMGHDVKRRINDTTNPALKKEIGQNFELISEMLTGENDMDKIVEAIDRIESEIQGEYKNKLHTLIATSLISHGVDLDRINAFFMAGMPSKQAEYIQASSRSARSHAGLVLVCFRANDLRERSQYQYFHQNHIFMDRLVDPVPINRMSTKAIQRSLPGLLSGLLLSLHSQRHDKTIYNCNEYRKYTAKANVNGEDIQQYLTNQLKKIIGTDSGFFSITASEKANKFIENYFSELDHVLSMGNGNLKDEEVLNPITSFRDIEEGLPLYANRETTLLLAEDSSDYK